MAPPVNAYRVKNKKKNPPLGTMETESRIQQTIFTWHWNNLPCERGLLFMVHNQAANRIQGHRLKGLGMVRGVSDMIYLSEAGPILLEIKTPDGKQSPEQKAWEYLVKANGYIYRVVHSLEEAIKVCGWLPG